MAALAALAAGSGTWLLLTSVLDGRRHLVDPVRAQRLASTFRRALPALLPAIAAAVTGAAAGWVMFGTPLPALAFAGFASTTPGRARKRATIKRLELARAHWPQLIEELRILTGSLGHSIPTALFSVGRRAPAALRPAFADAEREWLLTTDLERSLCVLKERLDDATADTICETLLIAHEVGGSGLDVRLSALAEDRDRDLQHRRDAEARQAGARFARRFVLLVPAGMAVAGMSVGTGRAAYRSPGAQILVLLAIAMVVGCWTWAGRIMTLPIAARVLDR
jgi:tight adherence protein B